MPRTQKTRYKVPCNVHLFSDQIATLKALRRNKEIYRNDAVRVAVDDLLSRFPKDEKGLAQYVKEKTNDAGHT